MGNRLIMTDIVRSYNRSADELRPIELTPGIAPNALGSVLAAFGNTRVICAAILENKVPSWMQKQKIAGGWITAEYSMLPYSTEDRTTRAITRGKMDGRTVEIQRLIGRSLRAVVDLEKLPGYTMWIDCDVLQADGGTRTASITGAYVAARLAVEKLIAEGVIAENPFRDSVAAVSVGIYQNQEILDLDYTEDKDASVDFNVVMSGKTQFVELQGTGEETTFSQEQLDRLIDLAKRGIEHLTRIQEKVIADHLSSSSSSSSSSS